MIKEHTVKEMGIMRMIKMNNKTYHKYYKYNILNKLS